MVRLGRVGGAVLVAALAASGARAEEASPDEASTDRASALRAEVGMASVSRGYYCAYGDLATDCSNIYHYQYPPLLFTGELEAGLSRAFGLALGVRYANGPYLGHNRTFWEPSVDVVARFGSYRAGTSLRVRLGAGVWIGESGKAGAGGRIGVGATIRGHSALGLAMDGVVEAGVFSGSPISTLQLGIGPELVF